MNEAPRHAWLNGEIVPWDRCLVHARTQGAFWGANVFEGIRAYWQPSRGQLQIFRLADHLARLHGSMKCVGMDIAHSDGDLTEACIALLRANAVAEDAHIVIVAYFGMGRNFDPLGHTDDTGVHITAVPMPRSGRYRDGASACISTWRRIGDDTMPPRIKTGANYHNSRLAQHEAARNGYDTALFLNRHGTLAESPGACLMMLRNGRLCTPPGTSGVLEGITLATVSGIAERELGMPVEQRPIDRTELYLADEAFLCGTLAEIMPITSVDRFPIASGRPGALTRELQAHYEKIVRTEAAPPWSLPVYADRQSARAGDPVTEAET